MKADRIAICSPVSCVFLLRVTRQKNNFLVLRRRKTERKISAFEFMFCVRERASESCLGSTKHAGVLSFDIRRGSEEVCTKACERTRQMVCFLQDQTGLHR